MESIRRRWDLLPFAVKAVLLVLVLGIAVTATARAVSLAEKPDHSAPAATRHVAVSATRPARTFKLAAAAVRPIAQQATPVRVRTSAPVHVHPRAHRKAAQAAKRTQSLAPITRAASMAPRTPSVASAMAHLCRQRSAVDLHGVPGDPCASRSAGR